MKIFASILASPILANSFQSCFDGGNFLKQGFQKTQIGEAGKSTFTVANGIIQCEGFDCHLTCDGGYHFYGGNNISKCKEQIFGMWKWTMDIAEVSNLLSNYFNLKRRAGFMKGYEVLYLIEL